MMFPIGRLADLSSALLFQSLDHIALESLLPNLTWVFLAGGETLFRAGDVGDSMYVVVAGRLRIFTEGNNGMDVAIREIGRGESVGELAILTGNARSATVRAVRDTELARLSRTAYEDVLKRHPQLATQCLCKSPNAKVKAPIGPCPIVTFERLQ